MIIEDIRDFAAALPPFRAVFGLDFGEKTIGVAASDLRRTVATPIEVIRFAPLGDPVEIRIRGYNLSLRRPEAEQVMVRDA